jgi:hypothetical protein
MSAGLWHLQQKKERLKREIGENLDFLAGSVTTQGPSGGHILTYKEKAKTKSKYIRVGMVQEVRKMTKRNRKLKALLKELGEVNWDILKLSNPSG